LGEALLFRPAKGGGVLSRQVGRSETRDKETKRTGTEDDLKEVKMREMTDTEYTKKFNREWEKASHSLRQDFEGVCGVCNIVEKVLIKDEDSSLGGLATVRNCCLEIERVFRKHKSNIVKGGAIAELFRLFRSLKYQNDEMLKDFSWRNLSCEQG
jgi:hypothetical protein